MSAPLQAVFRLLPRRGLIDFSNPELEKWFQKHDMVQISKYDSNFSLFCACLCVVGSVWVAIGSTRPSLMIREGLIAALVWGMPWLIHRLRPRAYNRHRRNIVTAVRLGRLLLPTMVIAMLHKPQGWGLGEGMGGLASAMALGGLVCDAWALSLGFTLDFSRHFLVSIPLALKAALSTAPGFCWSPCATGPHTLRRFESLAMAATKACCAFLLPLLGPHPRIAQRDPAQYHCYALLVWLHVVLGVYLPCVAVYIGERGRRAAFLTSLVKRLQANQTGGGLTRDAALGLEEGEVLRVCVYDTMGAWVFAVVLMPALSAVTWMGVLMLAERRWEGGGAAA